MLRSCSKLASSQPLRDMGRRAYTQLARPLVSSSSNITARTVGRISSGITGNSSPNVLAYAHNGVLASCQTLVRRSLAIQRQDASQPSSGKIPRPRDPTERPDAVGGNGGDKRYMAQPFNPAGGGDGVGGTAGRGGAGLDEFMEAVNAPPTSSSYYPMMVLIGLAGIYASYHSGIMYRVSGIEALKSHDQIYFAKKKEFEERLDQRREERRRERQQQPGNSVSSTGKEELGQSSPSSGFIKTAQAETATGYTTYAWGRNTHGQLGNGASGTYERFPQLIAALKNEQVTQVSAGGFSSAIITQEGELLTWGCSRSYELGHGDDSNELIPRPVEGLHNVTRVAIGKQHMAAVDAQGSLYTWGNGYAGRLGHGDEGKKTIPTKVQALDGKRIVDVGAGTEHTLCVTDQGEVLQWGGKRGGREGIRTASRTLHAVPEQVEALNGKNIVRVSSGGGSLGALSADGTVYTWGSDEFCQLGHGNRSTVIAETPRAIRALKGKHIVQLVMGTHHAIALSKDGEVFAWGANINGQLGLGHQNDNPLPTSVPLHGEKAVQVAAGDSHSAILLQSGKLLMFGGGRDGQLGYGGVGNKNIPTQAELPGQAAAVDLGGDHSIALSRQ